MAVDSVTSMKQLYESFRELRFVQWLLLLSLLWVWAVWESLVSAVRVWNITDTYNHCFFVIPIAIYLIYGERDSLLSHKPQFIGWFSFVPILGALFVWMFGYVGNLDVLTHLAAFSLLPLLWASVLGWRASMTILFPLAFIMFSVPIGEELIPLFQEITAFLSVRYLEWSGIPVYREGLFIVIPEGRFLVAEACSGVRFFVSTIMLGSLCAYILFRSVHKRILFVLFSILMPILANSVRAYGIMLVGHFSGMKYAVGADHLIYGWFFFAIVTAILVFVGYFFQERREKADDSNKGKTHAAWFEWPALSPSIAIMIVFLGFGYWKTTFDDPAGKSYQLDFAGFENAIEMRSNQSFWQPYFPRAKESYSLLLRESVLPIELHVKAYLSPTRDDELISWENRIYDPEAWTLEQSEAIQVGGLVFQHVYIVSRLGEYRSVVYWYDVPGYVGPSGVKTKLTQSLNTLLSRGGDGLAFMLTLSGGGFDENSKNLKEFLEKNSDKFIAVTPW